MSAFHSLLFISRGNNRASGGDLPRDYMVQSGMPAPNTPYRQIGKFHNLPYGPNSAWFASRRARPAMLTEFRRCDSAQFSAKAKNCMDKHAASQDGCARRAPALAVPVDL